MIARPSHRKLVVVVAVAATLVAAILPPAAAPTLGASDKINHIAAFVVLAGLAAWAWPRAASWRIAIALSGFGALIEVVQAIPALRRDADVVDWIVDTAAVIVTLALVTLLRRWRARDRQGLR